MHMPPQKNAVLHRPPREQSQPSYLSIMLSNHIVRANQKTNLDISYTHGTKHQQPFPLARLQTCLQAQPTSALDPPSYAPKNRSKHSLEQRLHRHSRIHTVLEKLSPAAPTSSFDDRQHATKCCFQASTALNACSNKRSYHQTLKSPLELKQQPP